MRLDDQLQGDLAAFAAGLAWVLPRKQLDDFWPIGIPSSAIRSAPALLDVLLKGPDSAAVAQRNPTSLAILYLFLIHGMREVGLSEGDRYRCAARIFSAARQAKASPLFEGADGHRLSDPLGDLGSACFVTIQNWTTHATADKEYVAALNRLSASIWAFGEACCFYNHRLVTEKHGPYAIPAEAERVTLVRTAHSVDAGLLWPELHLEPPAITRFELLTAVPRTDAPWFDMFANPILPLDASRDTSAALLLAETRDGRRHSQPPLETVTETTRQLHRNIRVLLQKVGLMTATQLTRKVYRVMLHAAIMGDVIHAVDVPSVGWEYSSEAATIFAANPTYRSVPELLRYYDIRAEL